MLFASFVLIFEVKKLILVAYAVLHYKSYQIFSLRKSRVRSLPAGKQRVMDGRRWWTIAKTMRTQGGPAGLIDEKR